MPQNAGMPRSYYGQGSVNLGFREDRGGGGGGGGSGGVGYAGGGGDLPGFREVWDKYAPQFFGNQGQRPPGMERGGSVERKLKELHYADMPLGGPLARGGPVQSTGYARGGPVRYDEYGRVREEDSVYGSTAPKWNPDVQKGALLELSGAPGYAQGGEVEGIEFDPQEDERRRLRAEEASIPTGYTGSEQAAAQPQARGGTFSDVLDFLHKQFSPVSSAAAADNPPVPTGYGGSAAPIAPAGAGGYGGELVSGPPVQPQSVYDAARIAGTVDPRGEPIPGKPLSLRSDAPPTISGQQDTPAVPGRAPGRLGDVQREIAERPTVDPSKMNTLEKLIALPGALGQRAADAIRLRTAENELYTGASSGGNVGDRPVWKHIQEGLDNMLRGDRPHTPQEFHNLMQEMHNDPQADHNQTAQKTFDSLKTIEDRAAFTQALRDPYNKYLGLGQVALQNGNMPMAIKFIEQAHNLLPNNMKLNITPATEGGGFIATVRPETGGAGQAYSVRIGNAGGLYDLLTKNMQFDAVGKNGIQDALQRAVEATRPPDRRLTSTPGTEAENARIDERNQRLGYPVAGSTSALPTAAGDARAGAPTTDAAMREADMRRSGAYRVGDYAPALDRAPPQVAMPAGNGTEGGDPWALTAPRAGAPVGRVTAAPLRSIGPEAPAQQPGVAWERPKQPSNQEIQETEARQRFIDRVHGRPGQTAEVLTSDQALKRQAAPAAPATPAASTAPAAPATPAASTAPVAPVDQQAALTATGAATENRPPATPEQAVAVLRTYRGDRPPWPAARGQQWLRSPSTGLWQLR